MKYHFVIFSFLLSACLEVEQKEVFNASEHFLFLAHCYNVDSVQQRIDPRIEHLKKDTFSILMLGGDLTQNTTANSKNGAYLESIFGLKQKHVLWAPGNHDYRHPERIVDFLGKKSYIPYSYKGITVMALDTQLDSCRIVGNQQEVFQTLCDTIKDSHHLILIHHKLIWMRDHQRLEKQANEVANGGICEKKWCIQKNNFYQDIYPALVKLRKRGIKVICIGGDIGLYAKQFEHTTKDDIVFLASGLSRDRDEKDEILIFHYDSTRKLVKWEFHNLDQWIGA